MAAEELLPASRPLGPLAWALNEHGAALTLLPGPTPTGTVKVRLLYPEDEYLEKRCRRILADWLSTTAATGRTNTPAPGNGGTRYGGPRNDRPGVTSIRSLSRPH